MKKRVAVIGAGASGLAALKQCLEEGLEAVCFDQEPELGGLWRYVPNATNDTHSSAYASAVVNTSKEMLAFSDFPVPKDWPTYLPRDQVAQYLKQYCEHFKLTPHIKFNRKVVAIDPIVDQQNEHTGQWAVSYMRKKKIRTEVFDFVMVCTGHHWKPRMPDFPGMDTFEGKMIHSHTYRVPYPFKDDRVLVVGVGNSGVDIAVELADHASDIYLASRSGAWIIPKTTLFGTPTDHLSTRAAHLLPKPLLNLAMESLLSVHYGDLKKYGLKPQHEFFKAHPTVNEIIIPQIQSGKVKVKPNVKSFEGDVVHFEDGTQACIDTVIHCTGYLIDSPFVDKTVLGKEEEDSNRVKLYKHVFSCSFKNIAFIGLVQPFGSILPVAEMQSRWATRVFKGVCQLPSLKEMRDQEALDWRQHCQDYVPRERHTIQVDPSYMDYLASMIGCEPDLWKLWKTNWNLATQVTFGPMVAFQYRLFGPGKWDGAEQAINDANATLDLSKLGIK
ncbi:flavin monooxygenase-like protein [Gorgonomyces haynaldii]|nr:flavin monooxygenase-like protein [Gorgonomyces haynaldii]